MLRDIPTLVHPPREGEERVKRDGEEQLVSWEKNQVCGILEAMWRKCKKGEGTINYVNYC